MTSIFWFRRDLRLQDNPALLAASEAGDVLPVFIFSTDLGDDFDRPRIQFLVGSLKALDSDLGSNLVIRYGDPTEILAELCAEVNASTVYSTQSYSTYRRQEDEDVAEGLGAEGLSLELIGTQLSPVTCSTSLICRSKSLLPFTKPGHNILSMNLWEPQKPNGLPLGLRNHCQRFLHLPSFFQLQVKLQRMQELKSSLKNRQPNTIRLATTLALMARQRSPTT